jgi:soluble lytic murein transglycosylase-like protein
MIIIESSNNARAYNKATGAVGLMQLTPVIYKNLCGLTKEEAFEPEKNVACGSLFMAHLMKKYKGNIEKALLHYNNGYHIRNKEYGKKVLKVLDNLEK